MIKFEFIQIKIAEAIKHCGKTQLELGKLIGVGQSVISQYIKGTKTPSLDTFANLCAVLEVDANDILCVDTYNK